LLAQARYLDLDKKEPVEREWRLSLTTGIGYMTAQNPDRINATQEEHLNALKSGFLIQGNVSYFLSETWGPSISLKRFRTSKTTKTLSTDLRLNFIGLGVAARTEFSDTINGFLNGHIGYVHYNDTAEEKKGRALGFDGFAGLDFQITESFFFRTSLGFFHSNIYKVSDSRGWTYGYRQGQSLSRVEFTGGIAIYL
jgi:hypothetical protein